MSNPRPYTPGGSSGGGEGVPLGPEQNIFGDKDTANKNAAIALRNTYANANPDWLALYNADRSFIIRLTWLNNAYEFQRRNAAGSGWEAVTTVVPGTPGKDAEPGGGANLITVTAYLANAAGERRPGFEVVEKSSGTSFPFQLRTGDGYNRPQVVLPEGAKLIEINSPNISTMNERMIESTPGTYTYDRDFRNNSRVSLTVRIEK